MTSPTTGLPADKLFADGTTSPETSTTNIGAYMWSAIVAERLGIITHAEVVTRLDQTLDSLETMERHSPDGQYYNWYDHNTLQKIPFGGPPRLSSVDNGWLATALHVVYTSVPEVAARAKAIYDSMDMGVFHRVVFPGGPGADDGSGNRGGATYKDQHLDRILFHIEPSTGNNPCCYDTTVSESRIATYIGIAKGEIPDSAYFGQWRTFPDTCDWSWPETKPLGVDRTYKVDGATDGRVTVFEGAYPYNGTRVVPGWGGSMFEALMPALFVPEEKWGPKSWKINHPLTVAAQIHHGMVDAGYGYWGFSPANVPGGRVRAPTAWTRSGWTPAGTRRTRTTPWSITASRAARAARRSPTRRPRRTRTAWSPRTRHSWPSAGRRRRSWRTSRTSRPTSTSTPRGASATRSTSTRAPSRTPTCRSTRASSWPPSATRSATTCCATRSRRRRSARRSKPLIGMERFGADARPTARSTWSR